MTPDNWMNTTHDWRALVGEPHPPAISERPDTFAPGGVRHMLHEVLAYVADEVDSVEGAEADARCDVTALLAGSVQVRDHGRVTDTRRDSHGQVVREPVMATKELRFYEVGSPQTLPDGHPRRGMAVVAALSDWLVDENPAWMAPGSSRTSAARRRRSRRDGRRRHHRHPVHFGPAEQLAPVDDDGLARFRSDRPLLHLAIGDERR